MLLLIFASLLVGLFALIILNIVNNKPSKRDERLKQSLAESDSWIENEYQKHIRAEGGLGGDRKAPPIISARNSS